MKKYAEDTLIVIELNNMLTIDDEFNYVKGSSTIIRDNEYTQKKIGHIHYNIFNAQLFNSELAFGDVADSISSDEHYVIIKFLEQIQNEDVDIFKKKILIVEHNKDFKETPWTRTW
ncbi:hypothetical protein [Lysinibacillus sp. NPDC096212]|uniref:hypothetical protein n=1 Tax=unclassified Lysinibacillus TaxID=2636778 RepID=UPI0038255460